MSDEFMTFLGFMVGSAIVSLVAYKIITAPLLGKLTSLRGRELYFIAYVISALLIAVFVVTLKIFPSYLIWLTGILIYDLVNKKPPVPEAEKKQA